MIITNDTKITLGVMVILLGLAFSYGSLNQKVSNFDERLAKIELKIDNFSSQYLTSK